MKATLTATMTMGAASETTVAAVSICIGGNHGGDDDNYSGHCYGGSTATIAWSIRISLVDPMAAIVVVRTATVAAAETEQREGDYSDNDYNGGGYSESLDLPAITVRTTTSYWISYN
jgi:hypothetical protein